MARALMFTLLSHLVTNVDRYVHARHLTLIDLHPLVCRMAYDALKQEGLLNDIIVEILSQMYYIYLKDVVIDAEANDWLYFDREWKFLKLTFVYSYIVTSSNAPSIWVNGKSYSVPVELMTRSIRESNMKRCIICGRKARIICVRSHQLFCLEKCMYYYFVY